MAKKINLHYMVLIFLIVLLAVFMGFRSPYFFTAANLCVLVDNFIMDAIMALGMTLVIISGGIDLTVAGRREGENDAPMTERPMISFCNNRVYPHRLGFMYNFT